MRSKRSRFLLGEGVVGHQIMERRTIHISDLKCGHPYFRHGQIYFIAEGFATYSAVPLIAKGEVKGVLEVFQRSLQLERSANGWNFWRHWLGR